MFTAVCETAPSKLQLRSFAQKFRAEVSRRSFAQKFRAEVSRRSFTQKVWPWSLAPSGSKTCAVASLGEKSNCPAHLQSTLLFSGRR